VIAEHGRDGALSALWTMHCADADAASGPASAETLTLDAPLDELLARVRLGDGRLWVHLDATNPAQHALLATHFGFHPLAIEDTLNPATRVKVEEYDGYLFAVVRGVSLNETTDDPYDLSTHDLHAFLLPRVLVTVSAGPHPSVLEIRSRVQRSPDVLGRGLDRMLHALLDDIIDRYFPLLDRIDEFVDDVEERVFVNFDDTALRDIFQVKRLVLSLRRHLAPQREVLGTLANRPSPLLSPAAQLYFRDVHDHVLRLHDGLDTYRDLLASTMESYLTQVSNRLGATTKALSAFATMSLPFVIVSGMWGMNFTRIPLADWPGGFWLMLLLQLGAGVGLLALLRWRRLI
jgi:magnesium transporter